MREGGCWNPLFSRPFNYWEMEEVDNFLLRLYRKKSATNFGGLGDLGG